MPTTCLSGSIVANDQYNSTCSGQGFQASCVTGTVYDTINDRDPVTNYQCWPSWTGGNWAATRIVALSTSAPSPSPTSPPEISTPTSPPSSTSASSSSSNDNKAARIGGPVGGSIGGALLIATAVGVIWFMRKKRQEKKRARVSTVYIDEHGIPLPGIHIHNPKPHWSVHEADRGIMNGEVDMAGGMNGRADGGGNRGMA
ncbi:hypothetical protein K469DRAFT_699348 [Zopfia rhizophila CBS 207.26]|uniref:Uncharacterized protein n=1 Tax=Zopfia rhizophila CBS 207.26 TaxID=1314779 RepID=A0A6A6EY54_9PEZI|nr:hypothetical protein K469DRAFT_699348 [Zopfia rhizophila CBS 207.26]